MKKEVAFESEKCATCGGKCCRYILVDLPTPRSRIDYNNYAWYLAHENMAIYIDDGKWYLTVFNDCRYLDSESKCSIYDKRFQACRDHTDENCEYDSNYVADVIFRDPFELMEYGEKKFRKAARKRALVMKNRKNGR